MCWFCSFFLDYHAAVDVYKISKNFCDECWTACACVDYFCFWCDREWTFKNGGRKDNSGQQWTSTGRAAHAVQSGLSSKVQRIHFPPSPFPSTTPWYATARKHYKQYTRHYLHPTKSHPPISPLFVLTIPLYPQHSYHIHPTPILLSQQRPSQSNCF